MYGPSYTIKEPVTISGKPFHGGGLDKLTFEPKDTPGIVLKFHKQLYPLTANLISPTQQFTARYNKAVFDIFSVNVIEHRLSAIITALGPNAGIVIDVKEPVSYLYAKQKDILFPYDGGGILHPYEVLFDLKVPLQCDVPGNNVFNIPTVDGSYSYRVDGAKTAINYYTIAGDGTCIVVTHPSGAKIKISPATKHRVTVHGAHHPDVPILKSIDVQPYCTDYNDTPREALGARALRRTAQSDQYVGAQVLTHVLRGHGLSKEGYFFANPWTNAEQLVQSMQPYFRTTKNEHLAHTAHADFPSEAWLLMQALDRNDLPFHIEIRDSTHESRVGILRVFAELISKYQSQQK